jgi:hypothetical protein
MQTTVNQAQAPVCSTPAARGDTTAVTVVKNESGNEGKVTANVMQYFENLAVERQAWENTAYRTSNEQLYVLLQKCYQTYKAMAEDTAEGKALRSGLKDFINIKGLKFNASTHTIVKIVKCVFGDDRRRVSAYGIVLRSALAQNISVFDIPSFIRTSGGVEEIRLAKAPNAMTAKQKAIAAADIVQANSLGVFSSSALGQRLDAGNIGKAVVLLGTWQADGSVVIRTVVEHDSAVNAALSSFYSANKGEIKRQAEQQQAANDQQVKQAAIDSAVNAAVAIA